MKILHSESSRGWGGQEIRTLKEMVALQERGLTVELVCPAEAEIGRRAAAIGLPVHHAPMTTGGDLASMDTRGYCRIEGRLKDMIIRGGENIYPREIEDVLFAHPAVAEVAVVGIPDDKWGETVAAFVRPAADATVRPAEAHVSLSGDLPSHTVIRHNVPLTPRLRG